MTTSQSTTHTQPMGGEDCSHYWSKKRLERLRKSLNTDAIISRAGARVVLYVKTLPGEDPTPHFEQLRSKARGRGWTVHHEIHDDAGGIQPAKSEAWHELLTILGGGSAQGVLTPSYRHISIDPTYYTNALDEIAEYRCFASLLIPEPST
ncbi:hypothetical protein [Streptomyces sp. NPDC056361]|uniref:hypothetical protein n=1 Tax=Streptomyces sp. NPDC056361 TaxID=3345795 RepID=UPI0035E01F08